MNEQIGLDLKEQGLDLVEAHNERWVDVVRRVAQVKSALDGQVSTDDLRDWVAANGVEPKHQNAWGAIFRGANWICVGRTKSRWPTNHAREIRVWRWIHVQESKAA